MAYEYATEVNKGSINMTRFTAKLNDYARLGWRLHTALEQHGNTVVIFEHEKK
jgi:hypothetical protein